MATVQPLTTPKPKTPKPAEGWVEWGEGWVPPDHPLAQQQDRLPTPVPSAAPVPKTNLPTGPKIEAPPMPGSPGPGWVNVRGYWVPPNHPLATGRPDPTPNLPVQPVTPQPVQQWFHAFQQPTGGAPSSAPQGFAPSGGTALSWFDQSAYGDKTAPTAPAPDLSQMPYLGQLYGFDHNKLGNAAHNTIKYQFGRLAAKYAPTPAGFAQLLADPAFKGLGIQSVGNGNIRLPSGEIIDVVLGWQQGGGRGWWWGPKEPGEQAGPTPGGGTPPGQGPSPAPGQPAPGQPPPGAVPDPSGQWPYLPEPGRWDPTTNRYIATTGKQYIWNGLGWVPVATTPGDYVPGRGVTPPVTGGIPGYPGTLPPSDEFTDPTTQALEDLLNWRVGELIKPVTNPARNQYASLLQQFVESLSKADPAYTNMIGSLETLAKNLSGRTPFEDIGEQQLSWMEKPSAAEDLSYQLAQTFQRQDPTLAAAAGRRRAELGAEPYTDAEWELYRTLVLDPIERDRTAANQRDLANIASRGFNPDSGIAQALMRETNRGFDEIRAREQGELGRARIQERRGRQGELFNLEQTMADLLQGRQAAGRGFAEAGTALERDRAATRTGLARNLADWTAGRQGQAADIYGALADLPVTRAGQQLTAAQSLDSLAQQVSAEEQGRRAEAVALQQLLAELPERRLQLALATLGQGETPGSLVGQLTGLAGLANQRAAVDAQRQATAWGGLGNLGAILASMYAAKQGAPGAVKK